MKYFHCSKGISVLLKTRFTDRTSCNESTRVSALLLKKLIVPFLNYLPTFYLITTWIAFSGIKNA